MVKYVYAKFRWNLRWCSFFCVELAWNAPIVFNECTRTNVYIRTLHLGRLLLTTCQSVKVLSFSRIYLSTVFVSLFIYRAIYMYHARLALALVFPFFQLLTMWQDNFIPSMILYRACDYWRLWILGEGVHPTLGQDPNQGPELIMGCIKVILSIL